MTHTNNHGIKTTVPRSYMASTRTIPDHSGRWFRPEWSRINTAVVNFTKLPCWHFGAFTTFPYVLGSKRIDMELHGATRLTFRI
ncbi:hypothetical protein DPMN_135347 [Dreissena polymorpha]|uniref:Uncharacterized protein n=1 Tax=Dreissena polymorpha TaxID=45954 RepID=A0A9D4G1Q7_DREPO|nr:hypothetical protein DPMN_135347 [Dreissena polymorpha]